MPKKIWAYTFEDVDSHIISDAWTEIEHKPIAIDGDKIHRIAEYIRAPDISQSDLQRLKAWLPDVNERPDKIQSWFIDNYKTITKLLEAVIDD